ncbi:MAG TPA: TRAP transporter small permease [Alphaproteobacteria bacterium]|nr:TRAP transporter small permease [Alphaproteobacteria bacterium]
MTGLFRLLDALERTLLAAIMMSMVVLYCGAIAVREMFPSLASSVAWVDEATRYLLVWMVFLGLGLALARGKQVAMSAFLDRMPDGPRRLVRSVIDLVGLVFSLYVVWVGVEITQLVAASGQRSPTLGISAAFLYATLPVGFALIALRYGASLFGLIDRWSVAEHTPAGGEV